MKHNYVLFIMTSSLLLVLVASCKSSQYGSRKKEEKLAIIPNKDTAIINYAMLEKQKVPDAYVIRGARGFVDPTPMVGSVVSLAVKGIENMIANKQKKYTAEYCFALNDMYFYNQLSERSVFDPTGMQFNGFTVVRTFKDANGNIDTAMTATFAPDTSNLYEIINNSFFRLKLMDIKVDYAKAKMMAKKYPRLNMDFEITFYTTYVTESGQLNSDVVLGTFRLPLRNIPLNKNDENFNNFFEKMKGKQLEGQSFIVPRSYSYRMDEKKIVPTYSQGLYSVMVRVTESSKNIFTGKLLTNSSNFIIEGTGKSIKSDEVTKRVFKIGKK